MILLASILLEPKRWQPGRPSSIRVSDWSTRAIEAGFDGWELFQNHYRQADATERQKLETTPPRVRVFNTYESFEDAGQPGLRDAIDHAVRLGAEGIKFNVGNEPARAPDYRACIERVARKLPANVRLLCECHAGTLLEDPGLVVEFAAGWTVWPFDVIIHPFLLEPDEIARWGQWFGNRIRHAHVQMRDRRNEQRVLALDDDAPRARDCLAALAAINFAGTFSIEFASPTGTADDEPEKLFAAARRDFDFLRAHWRG